MWNNIQSLRFIAAFLVLLCHMMPHYEKLGASDIVKMVGKLGYVGVDIFFVISGLVVAKSLDSASQTSSLTTFFKKRLFRIFPTYWIYLLLYILVLSVFMPERLSLISILESISLTQYNPTQVIMGVSWTLSFEVYFYLIISIAFFLFRHDIVKTTVYMSLFYLIVVTVVRVSSNASNLLYDPNAGLSIFSLETAFPMFYFSPLTLEFMSGCGLYCLSKKGMLKSISPVFTLITSIILFAISTRVFTTPLEVVNNMGMRVIIMGSASFLLVASFLITERFVSAKPNNIFVLLGSSSFTLYLMHMQLFELSFGYLKVLDFMEPLPQALTEVMFLILITVTIIISHLLSRIIELPLYEKLRNKFCS